MTGERLFDEAFLRRLEGLTLLYRQAARSSMQGERRSVQRGQSVEFSDFRPYTPGDDFRRIDWNAYARLERLFLKLFVEEVDVPVHLVIDASRSMDWGEPNKLEFSLRLAAALGFIALAGLDRVSARLVGSAAPLTRKQVPTLRGKRSALTLFNFLQSAKNGVTALNSSNPRFSAAIEFSALATNASQAGPLLLFSDLMDEGWQAGLNRLAGKGFEITLIHVLSPDEANPEFEGDYKLVDSETQSQLEISADFEILHRYRQFLAKWQEDWHRFCAARRMHYIPAISSQSLEELLFSALPQQGTLR